MVDSGELERLGYCAVVWHAYVGESLCSCVRCL